MLVFKNDNFFFSLILLIFLIAFSSNAGAVSKNSLLYKVSEIAVDATADTAVKAREKGLRTARLEAFRTLAKRILSKAEYETLSVPNDEVIQNMIQGIQISNEKMANNRYLAEVSFRFNVSSVTNYFGETGQVIVKEASKPTLIIPFYQSGNNTILWDKTNIWRQAWDGFGQDIEALSSLTPIYLPLGDLQDMSEVPDINALTAGRAQIIEMGERYGAYQVLASIFMMDPVDEANPDKLSARIFVFGYNQDPTVQVSDTLMVEGASQAELLNKGVYKMVDWLEENWKQLNLAQTANKNIIPVQVNFRNLEHWVRMSEQLRNIGVIQNLDVELLQQGHATTNIEFRGSIDGLKIALQKEGFKLDVLQKRVVNQIQQSSEDRLMSGLFGTQTQKEEIIRTYRITDMQ